MKISDFDTGAKLKIIGFMRVHHGNPTATGHHGHAQKHMGTTHKNLPRGMSMNSLREYRHKLAAMGLIRGTVFTIDRKAPLGDPVVLKVRGFYLALRAAEADILDVEPVK